MKARPTSFVVLVGVLYLGLCAAVKDCILSQYDNRQNSLCGGGFLLRVTWFGRLGNNLLQLANVLHLSEETRSEALVDRHPFLNKTSWNFREQHDKCQLAVTDDYFFSNVCPSLLDKTVFSVKAQRSILQEHVLPAFQSGIYRSTHTVVVHVRGGDVFSTGPPSIYVQPPLAFYRAVLNLPKFDGAKIIVSTEDDRNPVVNALRKLHRGRITVLTDLKQGIATVLGAQHLILGHSSFSELLGMMARDLQSVYFPFCSVREGLYTDLRISSWGVPGLCFEYDGYIGFGEWENTPEQLQLMLRLSSANVHNFSLPV